MTRERKTTKTEMVRVSGKLVPSPRGEVPLGARDIQFNSYLLDELHLRKDDVLGNAVRFALSAAKDPRFHQYVDDVCAYTNYSPAAIAQKHELALIDFQNFWKDAQNDRSVMIAINAIPDLTRDLIEDSKSREDQCPICDGQGTFEVKEKTKICPECRGRGTIRVIGDKESRKTLMKMSGVIKDQPAVVINQDMRSVGMATTATRLAAAMPFEIDVANENE